MIDNLAEALRALKDAGADAMPVLPADAFAGRFHGLSLSQVVALTDVPAIAVTATLRTAEGAVVERCMIDGRASERRSELATRLVLGAELADGVAVREVLEFEGGVLRGRLLRDRDGVVYRAEGDRATVDTELTAVLRGRHLPAPDAARQPEVPDPDQPVLIRDRVSFSGAVGGILQGLAALHAGNQAASAALRRLAATSDPAAAAEADALAAIARQVEAVVVDLQHQSTVLLQLLDRPSG